MDSRESVKGKTVPPSEDLEEIILTLERIKYEMSDIESAKKIEYTVLMRLRELHTYLKERDTYS
jgi:hypothetical protein